MNDWPLVSVLTPSFQQGQWLADNLRSVACQTYPKIEHVVMDGGSTDSTVEILRQAGPNVRWSSEPDRGQSHAINKAFAKSRGDIIGWLNSDDAYWDRGVVQRVVSYLHQHPDIDAVYGHAALVNADGLIIQMIWAPPFWRRMFRVHNFIIQPTVFVRRRILGDWMVEESYDYSMDRELWLRLARRHRFARLDTVLAIDRYYPARKSATRLDLAEIDYQRLWQTYRLPSGILARVELKLLKVLFRFIGLRLLRKQPDGLAFAGTWDSRIRLILRQIAVPRGRTPQSGAVNNAATDGER